MSKDTIYREDAIKATWQEPTYTDPLNVLTEVRDRIEAIPSADRSQGEWIYTNNPLRLDDEWECSRCGNISFVKTNFCDRCGARMKGADDETD